VIPVIRTGVGEPGYSSDRRIARRALGRSLCRLVLGAFVASVRVAVRFAMPRIDLPLADLSVAQKLDLMERMWADLSANEKDLPSPEWHGTLIADRLRAVEEGQSRYGDWDEAKARLRLELQ